MTRRLPSLNALRCFDSVAAHLSIRRAAQTLSISESAVSRQIRILEEQLGHPLFLRSHNGLEITEAGQRLAVAVREAFDHIESALNPFRSDADEVTIRVLPTFALRWLYPRLHRFQAQHPLVRITVQTRLNDMNAGEGDADLGIRYGIGNWPADAATELYKEWVMPVCAPGYLPGGRLESEADFAGVTFLHPLPNRQDWSIWCGQAGLAALDMQRSLDFDALDMALSAAESGHGLAISDIVLAHGALAAGRLVAPRQQPVPTGLSYYLVRPPNLKRKRPVTLLAEWLREEIREAEEIIAQYRG
jgi:LysR family transcriptional regulator, glycine cleavage system transcriptional activator